MLIIEYQYSYTTCTLRFLFCQPKLKQCPNPHRVIVIEQLSVRGIYSKPKVYIIAKLCVVTKHNRPYITPYRPTFPISALKSTNSDEVYRLPATFGKDKSKCTPLATKP